MLCLTNSYASEKLNPIVVGATIKPIDIHSSPASLEIFTSDNIRQEGFEVHRDDRNTGGTTGTGDAAAPHAGEATCRQAAVAGERQPFQST